MDPLSRQNVRDFKVDFSFISEAGSYENSSKRGNNYVTLLVDLGRPRTMFIIECKDVSTLIRFKEDFECY